MLHRASHAGCDPGRESWAKESQYQSPLRLPSETKSANYLEQEADMTNQVEQIVHLNGIHGRKGSYLLSLSEREILEAARKQTIPEATYQELKARYTSQQLAEESGSFELAFGRDPNILSQAGWAVIFPATLTTQVRDGLVEALKPLLAWRKEQSNGGAEELYKEYITPEEGVGKGESALNWMKRHGATPGTVNPNFIPYYLLLVGSPQEIPLAFQYELDATYLVGRLFFGKRLANGAETYDLEDYARYAARVVAAEKGQLKLPRRAVFFGPAHKGDSATQQSSTELIAPLYTELSQNYANQGWQIEHVQPADSKRDRLLELMGARDAPALLFTASHGLGFDVDDPEQEKLQGAVLCQDFEQVGMAMERDYYVAGEDILDDFSLHGLITFHFACFGAGTPLKDNFYHRTGNVPEQIAKRDFLAALPTRLLSHPRGGALAVCGHIDRAWTYSFKWGQAKQQTETFRSTIARLLSGQPVGLAFDDINMRYAQLAVNLQPMLDEYEVKKPDPAEIAGLWTANNDARGYTLLGDPAVRLAVADQDETPGERKELAPVELNSAVVQAAEESVPPPDEEQKPFTTPQAPPPSNVKLAGGAVTIDITPQGHVTLRMGGGQLSAQAAGTGEDFESFWAKGMPEGQPVITGTLDDVWQKMRQFLVEMGQKVENFAQDLTTLEVRTYVSDAIDKVDVKNGKLEGEKVQRAVTVIKLDGDTEVVVPTYAGEIDQALWAIHLQTVAQAQAHRAEMVKTLGELVASLIPGGK
jgi:hypothetical protein